MISERQRERERERQTETDRERQREREKEGREGTLVEEGEDWVVESIFFFSFEQVVGRKKRRGDEDFKRERDSGESEGEGEEVCQRGR